VNVLPRGAVVCENTIAVEDHGTEFAHRPFAVRGRYSPCEGDGLMGAAEFGGAWLTQGRLSRLECCSSDR
jgi:hypothetical protein